MIKKQLNKLKNLGQPLCHDCGIALVTYRPKKISLNNLLQFRYQCPRCHKAFLLPTWVIWLFFALFVLFSLAIKSPLAEAFLMVLFDPLIELRNADKLSMKGFAWSSGIIGIVFCFTIAYIIIKFGSKFMRNQLIEIPHSELKDWKVFHRDTRKEIINDLKDIKHFPLWQKIVAILFALLVFGLVVWSYS